MEPVEAHAGVVAQTGSPVTGKLRVAFREKALVTVAVRVGVVPAETQEGAVQEMRLVLAPWVGVPSVPVLAVQANVRVLDWGSRAVTSKATVWPGAGEEGDWEELVKEGGKRSRDEAATQRLREPVVCPPRPSLTVTVRRQLLQALAGTEDGTKEAELEVAFVQVPAQEAVH